MGANLNLAKEFRLADEAVQPWAVRWARTAREAGDMLEAEDFAAVVAESQLEDMSGADFLDQVMVSQPRLIRILRFHRRAIAQDLQGVGQAHHLFREPCNAARLGELLERIEAVQQGFPNPALPGLVGKMRQLPSPPNLYFEVVAAMASDNASLAQIGELIARDTAATAKLLQLANSAAFGLHGGVTHPVQAVHYLGFELTKALLLIVHSFAFFESVPAARSFLAPFWGHAQNVARCAREIVRMETADSDLANQAFTGGLLHDVGQLLFAANLPEEYGQVLKMALQQAGTLWELEWKTLGASHAELGAYLLGIWNLPAPIVEAVAWHHCPVECPNRSETFSPLTAVHVANVLAQEQRREPMPGLKPSFDWRYLAELGCEHRLTDWRESCQPLAAAA